MQSVSNYYLSAIEEDSQTWVCKVLVKTSASAVASAVLTDSEIYMDTFTVTRSALDSSYMGITGANSDVLSLSLTEMGIEMLEDLGMLKKGILLDCYAWLLTSDPNQSTDDPSLNTDSTENTSGRVHIGQYYISDIDSDDFSASIRAYDCMLAFDVPISDSDRTKLYSNSHDIAYWLGIFCESCTTDTYVLTLDPNISNISGLANMNVSVYIDEEDMFSTYRDAIKQLAQLAGGFASITADGYLTIVPFSKTVGTTITQRFIYGYKLAPVQYTVQGIKTSVAGYNYTATGTATGTELINLWYPENMYLRQMQDAEATDISSDITDCLDAVAGVLAGLNFFGGSYDSIFRPELELGDMTAITVRTVKGGAVTDVTYGYIPIGEMILNFGNVSTIKSYGYEGETSSSATSSSSKSGSVSIVNGSFHIVGADDITLGENETKTLYRLVRINSRAGIEVFVNFTGTATITGAGSLYFKITYDNVEYSYSPKYTVACGYQTFSFGVSFSSTEFDATHFLKIELISTGAELEMESTDYQIAIFSNGASQGGASWTGYYECSDTVPNITFNNLVEYVAPASEEVTTTTE